MNLQCTRACALLFFCTLSFAAWAQTSVKSENYPDGKPKLYSERLDGQADGMWYEWYPSGQLRYRARWRKGKGHGEWEYFYENGQLRSRTVYAEDLPQGVEVQYHPNGALKSETVYVNGRRHGETRTYDDRGNELSRQLYLDGRKVLNRPIVFAPGIVSGKNSQEWGLDFAADGNTVYFTRRTAAGGPQKIYGSSRTEEGWSSPKVLPFSTDTDESPFLSPDGRTLYFASYRPMPGSPPLAKHDMNLWRVGLSPQGWGRPEPLPRNINRVMAPEDKWPYGYEAGPALDPNGNLLYWTGLTADGQPKVVMAPLKPDGDFGPPTPVDGINGGNSDSGAVVSPDGRLIVWASYQRNDGLGKEDLYYAIKTSSGWGEAVHMGPLVNSSADEGCPRFSPDGKHFYFCSDRAGGQSDIYYMESAFAFPE